ncbi:MAG: hypothetical protein HQL37_13745, partial [Alphaproteobacteria bacterium]|nr:hypothetical protein [Alphaproteobacteria bacterium]
MSIIGHMMHKISAGDIVILDDGSPYRIDAINKSGATGRYFTLGGVVYFLDQAVYRAMISHRRLAEAVYLGQSPCGACPGSKRCARPY